MGYESVFLFLGLLSYIGVEAYTPGPRCSTLFASKTPVAAWQTKMLYFFPDATL
jgi:hypothetical protein